MHRFFALILLGAALAVPGTTAAPIPGFEAIEARPIDNRWGNEFDLITDAAFSGDGSLLLATGRISRNLAVWDAATGAFQYEVALSGEPFALAVAASAEIAVTANRADDTVSIISLGLGPFEEAVVSVGNEPALVRVTPDGTIAAALGIGTLSIIDVTTATELVRVPARLVRDATGYSGATGYNYTVSSDLELTPDGSTAITLDFAPSAVQFVDIPAGTTTSIPVSDDPFSIDLSADGNTAVVLHGSAVATVIDVPSRTIERVVSTSPVGGFGFPVVEVTADGSRAIVSENDAIRVLDPNTGALTPTINRSIGTRDAALTSDESHALIAGTDAVLVDLATGTLVDELPGSYLAAATSSVGERAALAQRFDEDRLLLLDTSADTLAVLATIEDGFSPEADTTMDLAVTPDGQRVVCANRFSANISILGLPNGVELAVRPVGEWPRDVVLTPGGATAVVALERDTHLALVDLGTLAVTEVELGDYGFQVEVSPDGTEAYVATRVTPANVGGSTESRLWRVDLATQSVEGPALSIPGLAEAGVTNTLLQPNILTLNSDGTLLAVACAASESVAIVDLVDWSVDTVLPLEQAPHESLFSADSSELYVTTNYITEPALAFITLGATPTVEAEIPLFGPAYGASALALGGDGQMLYVAHTHGVDVIDLTSRTIINTMEPTIGGTNAISQIHLSDDGETLFALAGRPAESFAAQSGDGNLLLFDTATETYLGAVNLEYPGSGLVWVPSQQFFAIPQPRRDGLILVAPAGFTTAVADWRHLR